MDKARQISTLSTKEPLFMDRIILCCVLSVKTHVLRMGTSNSPVSSVKGLFYGQNDLPEPNERPVSNWSQMIILIHNNDHL